MRPKSITMTFSAPDRNGVSVAQTTTGAANLTITGNLASGGVATFSQPRHVSIYSGGDESDVTFTVYGTDRYGASISEAITGPNTTTVYGSKNFKTVTRVAAGAAVGNNVEVGDGNEAESQWVPCESHYPAPNIDVSVASTGDLSYEVEGTLDDPWGSSFDESTAETCTVPEAGPIRAFRTKITAVDATSGGALTMRYAQRSGG